MKIIDAYIHLDRMAGEDILRIAWIMKNVESLTPCVDRFDVLIPMAYNNS